MSKKHKAGKEKTAKDKPGKEKKAKSAPAPGHTGDEAVSASQAPAVSAEALPSAVDAKDKESSEKARHEARPKQFTLISKALADPTRMAVLRSIAKGGATCGDLRECAGVSAATLSHHMKELEAAGLIETERQGRFVSATFQRRTWKQYLDELKSLSK